MSLLTTLVGAAGGARAAQPAAPPAAQAQAGPAGFGSLLTLALGTLLGTSTGTGTTAAEGEAGAGADTTPAKGEALAGAELAGATGAELAGATGAEGAQGAALAAAAPAAPAPAAAAAAAPATATTAGAGAAAERAAAEMAAAADVAAPAEGEAPAALADAGRPYRGMDRLDGEFRTRFERVVERMASEFGHKVEVVETWRDSARQEHLFQQGRTRPGPVVTWTRDSNHLSGRAADVIIDDSYGNPGAYARLAQIAQQEGLRTLGARDPGHLELPRNTGSPAGSAASAPAAGATGIAAAVPAAIPAGGMAQVARVATVARVAQVATVARVAQPGRAAAAGPSAAGLGVRAASAGAARAARAEPAPMEAELARLDALVPGLSGAERTEPSIVQEAGAEARAAEQAEEALAAEVASAAADASREASQLEGGTTPQRATAAAAEPPRGGVQGAAAVERLARVMELQADLSTRPMQSMLLRVEGADGAEDRIRVDLRGGGVEATLDLASRTEATQLGTRVEELTRALERQGLEAEVVRIRTTQPAGEGAELARAAVAAAEAQSQVGGARAGSEGGLGRERGQQQPGEQQHARPDHHNQRSRREPKGEKNQ